MWLETSILSQNYSVFVQRIRLSSKPEQRHYAPDHASRFLPVSYLAQTSWFTGPSFLCKPVYQEDEDAEDEDEAAMEKDQAAEDEAAQVGYDEDSTCL